MKKNFLAVALATSITASLCACGGSKPTDTTVAAVGDSKTEETAATAAEVRGRLQDWYYDYYRIPE